MGSNKNIHTATSILVMLDIFVGYVGFASIGVAVGIGIGIDAWE